MPKVYVVARIRNVRRWLGGAIAGVLSAGVLAALLAHPSPAPPRSFAYTTLGHGIVTTTTTELPETPPSTVEAPVPPLAPTTVDPPTTVPARAVAVRTAPAPVRAPAPAPAPANTSPQDTGRQALAMLSYPWQQLGYSVTFEGANPGLLGKTDCATNAVTIYVRSSQSVRQVAFVTAFELAHAVDCTTMTDDRRGQWAAIRGFPAGYQWFPGCLCTEDHYGSGDFSMVFASWQVPDGGYPWRSTLAAPPSQDELQRLLPYLQGQR